MGVVSALAGLSQPPRSTVCLVPEGATQSGVPAAIRELGACSLVHSSVTHPPARVLSAALWPAQWVTRLSGDRSQLHCSLSEHQTNVHDSFFFVHFSQL